MSRCGEKLSNFERNETILSKNLEPPHLAFARVFAIAPPKMVKFDKAMACFGLNSWPSSANQSSESANKPDEDLHALRKGTKRRIQKRK